MTWFEKLIIIICILITLFCIAMLARGDEVHGNLEIGWVKDIESIEVELHFEYYPLSFWCIYGGFETLVEYYTLFQYCPYRIIYETGSKLNLTEHIYIDVFHSCTHPVYSYQSQFDDHFMEGSKTEFAIGIEW